MNKLTSVLATTLVLGGALVSSSASAATYCYLNVKNFTLLPTHIEVETYYNTYSYPRDTLFLSYQDSKLGQKLEKLAEAKSEYSQVKVYLREEFGGDDANSCRDGIGDYAGVVTDI